MTDVVGNPEEERRAEFYFQPWAQEAVCRYFYSKVMFYTCLATEIFEISKVAWEITLLLLMFLSGSAKEAGAGTGSWHSKHISKLAAVTTQDQRGFWLANVLQTLITTVILQLILCCPAVAAQE